MRRVMPLPAAASEQAALVQRDMLAEQARRERLRRQQAQSDGCQQHQAQQKQEEKAQSSPRPGSGRQPSLAQQLQQQGRRGEAVAHGRGRLLETALAGASGCVMMVHGDICMHARMLCLCVRSRVRVRARA